MGAIKLEETNPLLDKKLINAFIDGVIKTHSSMASTLLKTGDPRVENQFTPKGEISGLVGMVAGTMKGTMSISYEKQAILSIYENMLGEKHSDISSEVADCVGEITNMIYGSAKTILNQMGYAFEMAIPSVVKGTIIISKHHKGATLVLPFKLENGSQFYIDITVQA
jgi:chemotaxis protein CheX